MLFKGEDKNSYVSPLNPSPPHTHTNTSACPNIIIEYGAGNMVPTRSQRRRLKDPHQKRYVLPSFDGGAI